MHTLKTAHSISKLDIVISNSGIAKHIGPALETPMKELQDHFNVNTVSHLLLFQATWPLLTAAPTPEPKFIVISSSVGSISGMEREPVPMLAYGCSKAATNYLVRKLHFEHEKLVCFSIHPGYVVYFFLQKINKSRLLLLLLISFCMPFYPRVFILIVFIFSR